MRSNTYFSVFFLLLFSFQMNAQEDIWNYESIGFHYSAGASTSEIIRVSERQISNQDYDSIVALLESTSIVDQFVGSILCEFLADNDKIDLSEIQIRKIQSIQLSSEKLLLKDGCTCREALSLSEFFSKRKKPCHFRKRIKTWKKHLEEKYF